MKSEKKRHFLFAIVLILSFALILTGLFSMISVYKTNRDTVIEYQNRHLLSIVASVSRSWDAYLESYSNALMDFILRSNVISAEWQYMDLGNTNELLNRMEFHREMMPKEIQASITMQDQDGGLVGMKPVACDEAGKALHLSEQVVTHVTRSAAGEYYLSFCYLRPNGLTYSIQVPLESLLKVTAGNIVSDGTLFVIDEDLRAVCLANKDGTRVMDMEQLCQQYPGLDFSPLVEQMRSQIALSTVYEPETPVLGLGDSFLLDCSQVHTTQGMLLIGIAEDMDEATAAMRSNSLRMAASLVLMALGVVLLAVVAIRSRQTNIQVEQELQLLEEQSRLLQQVNSQRQREFHAQRLQEVGTMAAGIVHEFNNLLTPIMGYSLMTLDALPPEDTENSENLMEIYNASRKAKDVVRQIGQLSRQNADMTHKPLELDRLIRQALGVATLARQGPIEVSARLECPGILIFGNETMLHQTILNLCINACQAMGTQGGVLTVQTRLTEYKGKKLVELTVSDTGPGIDPAIIERIFEPFFTTKEAGRGTGLGLAISRHVVELHGGVMYAENLPEGGAKFTIQLPLLPPPPEMEA